MNINKFNKASLYGLAHTYNTQYIQDTFPSDIALNIEDIINTQPNKQSGPSFYGLNRSLTSMKTVFDDIRNNITNGWTLKDYQETNTFGEKGYGTYAVTHYDTPIEQNVQVQTYISPATNPNNPAGLSVASTSIPTITNISNNGYDDDVQIKNLTQDQLDEYKKKFSSVFNQISNNQSDEENRHEILTKENYTPTKGDNSCKIFFYFLIFSFVIIILSLKIFFNR